ncbi:MAG: radical SAM protein [Oscillospiraceae bacterium]|nr:radical SAM protein [Oscillospiraceae bacterium]
MSGYKVKSLYPGAGIIVTYKCSAACLHCCYSSSPARSGEYMSKQTAGRIFSLLGKMGCGSVHIGGGEPFLNFGKLLEVCRSAAEHRVFVDYIETNASWYTDEAAVLTKLQKLKETGVDCLLLSVDPFHNEFVAYGKLKELEKCCRKTGMGTFIWQSKFERIVSQMDENTTHGIPEYEDIFGKGFVKKIAESYGLGYNGRALGILEKIEKNRYPAEYFVGDSDVCQTRITSLGHFHVDLNEDLIPPSCNGFRANVFELCGEGLECDKYKYFTAVQKGGLGLFFKEAQKLGFVPKEAGYVSKCALCFDMKKFVSGAVRMKTGREAADIGPAEFFGESQNQQQ